MTTINEFLTRTTSQLAHSPSARLDAEVLLAHTLAVPRTWLVTHASDLLAPDQQIACQNLVTLRQHHTPVAYLVGHKEFYGREFSVTPAVLIPRPETETLVDLALSVLQGPTLQTVLDVGCGSGCLGITLKLEIPALAVTLSDISPAALAVARKNAKQLGADVNFVRSDLLSAFMSKSPSQVPQTSYDMVIANLPYVNPDWQRSPETDHEPALALFANDTGLELIKKCIQQAREIIPVGGHLLLEADPEQHESIVAFARSNEFALQTSSGYDLSFVHQS